MFSELRVLVLSRDGLDVSRIQSFINKCSNPRLALIHSSIVNKEVAGRFYKSCVDGLDLPFVGFKVSDTITNEGLFEDSVVVKLKEEDKGNPFNADDRLGKMIINPRDAQRDHPDYYKVFGKTQSTIWKGDKDWDIGDFFKNIFKCIFTILSAQFIGGALGAMAAIIDSCRKLIEDTDEEQFCYALF